MSASTYVFNNDEPTAAELLDVLATMLDGFTTSRLLVAGVPAGARCLEIGAGSGSIARWLADHAGETGEVIATDIKPRHIRAHPRVTVREHNIATDPLPEGEFDLIHARLVLAHLPGRREILARLAGALAPGGAIVIDEFEASWATCVLASPVPDAAGWFAAYHDALIQVLTSAGNDPAWGRNVHGVMRELGLTDVDTELHAKSWPGGTAGCLLPRAASLELWEKLVDVGMPAADLDAMRELLLDPRLVIRGNLALSTIGRRPT